MFLNQRVAFDKEWLPRQWNFSGSQMRNAQLSNARRSETPTDSTSSMYIDLDPFMKGASVNNSYPPMCLPLPLLFWFTHCEYNYEPDLLWLSLITVVVSVFDLLELSFPWRVRSDLECVLVQIHFLETDHQLFQRAWNLPMSFAQRALQKGA